MRLLNGRQRAAGVPAKIIKMRFSQDIIAKLMHIQWWNWSTKKIQNHINELQGPIGKFIK